MIGIESAMPLILIIDDEASILKMFEKFFRLNSYDVITADNGADGIALFHKHHPDVVITDVVMPDKEGLETIRELKSIDSDANIIAVTGGPSMYLKNARLFGAKETFQKPVDKKELLSTIKNMLE
ncbi:response regulator [Desulfobacter latus]|uniref:Response regulator n=1 Tax=Desulfobacter latus TaxID=2292 RepID=A0A850T0C5_9BACT|nr:response regulator [Desulfobacter latus]NWH05143.1 response regulator [Desulfobacter latus]